MSNAPSPTPSTPADQNKVALITGGGGSIAFELASRLQARGYDLVLCDRDDVRMRANSERLRNVIETFAVDLTEPDQVRSLAHRIRHEWPELSLLVNNAGYIRPGNLDEITPDELDFHISINLTSALHLTQAAVAAMRERGRGDILTLVSMGGIIPMPGSAAYSAAKAGLRAANAALNCELHGTDVRIMGLFPSGVDTPMLQFEAQNNGSPLNFSGKVFTPAAVAEAGMKSLQTGQLENYIPYTDSVTTRLAMSVPWCLPKILPMFAAQGEKGRAKYLAERGLQRLTE